MSTGTLSRPKLKLKPSSLPSLPLPQPVRCFCRCTLPHSSSFSLGPPDFLQLLKPSAEEIESARQGLLRKYKNDTLDKKIEQHYAFGARNRADMETAMLRCAQLHEKIKE